MSVRDKREWTWMREHELPSCRVELRSTLASLPRIRCTYWQPGQCQTQSVDMPLFEYRCLACESQFELLVRGAATPACPSCGATTLKRLLSMFAVSSEGASERNRTGFAAAQRQKSQAKQKEASHYRHDHHDD